MIEFYKFHGTGNDFIIIDNRQVVFQGDKVEFAKEWCNRRFGIGSDGVIFLENDEVADYLMDFYNPDGTQSFCGNGSRCAFAFARVLKIVDQSGSFRAIDGIHAAEFLEGLYQIDMNDVELVEEVGADYFIHTGSPHYISYCSDDDQRDIVEYGREIRFSERYKKEGTNVNLIKEIGAQKIELRTYERGVENETFACGTGATAAALSYAYKHQLNNGRIEVAVKGGSLKVDFNRNIDKFNAVKLIGPAEFVFKGTIDLE